jgi:MoxR-like ATPase
VAIYTRSVGQRRPLGNTVSTSVLLGQYTPRSDIPRSDGTRGHLGVGQSAPRAAASRLALEAVSSILEAAAPLELIVEGAVVVVSVARARPMAAPPPSAPDGHPALPHPALPHPVQLDCCWRGGSATLVLSAAVSRGPSRAGSVKPVGARIATHASDRTLVWVSLPPLSRAPRGDAHARLGIGASFSMVHPERAKTKAAATDTPASRGAALRGAVDRAGLPLTSPWYIEAFAVGLPEGEVLPLPGEAFRRLVHLALVKLPFLAAGSAEPLFEGAPPFDVDALPDAARVPEGLPGARAPRLYPLPGGVRRYKETLDALLAWIHEARPSLAGFRLQLATQYGAPTPRAADAYLRLLETSGFVRRSDEARSDAGLTLSDLGGRYLACADPALLFQRLHEVYRGLLEALVLADTPGLADTRAAARLFAGLVDARCRTANQRSFRRNWLLSLGLTDRSAGLDVVTPLGRQVIGAHAEEAAEIRMRIDDLLEEQFEEELAGAEVRAPQTPEPVDDEDAEPTLADRDPTLAATGAGAGGTSLHRDEPRLPPPALWADRIELTPAHATPHLALALPRAVLERACAALSSGKHLLLVGPPGTGKTELALALGAAAAAEGYCEGLFTATASADWTTFDTIGGYMLQKDGALRFRPGVFLTAVERLQWLLIDEVNRADVDRAFGELLTVLSGKGAVTPFALDDGRLVSIGPDAHATHRVPRAFRLIATMNTWDKGALFRLSYAIQRRFAVVHVGVPDDAGYARLLTERARDGGRHGEVPPPALAVLLRLFRGAGLLAHRPLGPAVALDVVGYLATRGAEVGVGDALAEAFAMYLLPQLEGLDPDAAEQVFAILDGELRAIASREARAELAVLYGLLFPHATLPEV